MPIKHETRVIRHRSTDIMFRGLCGIDTSRDINRHGHTCLNYLVTCPVCRVLMKESKRATCIKSAA